MKVRLLALAMSALVLAGLLATTPSGATSRSAYSLTSLLHMLISRTDLPTGWLQGRNFAPTEGSCSPVLTRQHLLGSNSVEVLFAHPGQQGLAFEYLAYRNDVVDAFQRADTFIYTFGSCGDTANGVVVGTAVNEGTIETRTFGTWSDADLYNYNNRGSKLQLGYLVVRDRDFLMIVGFGNRGTLKRKTLEGLTDKALANLPVA